MAKQFDSVYSKLISISNIPRSSYMSGDGGAATFIKRTQKLLDILGNPEKKIPHYIHVTGTSGKGSVVSFLHSILFESGKKVGSTHSPHPTFITERWKVGKSFMTKSEFVKYGTKVLKALETYIQKTNFEIPSYFEITEVIGLLYFAEKKVDWVVFEVGCGGRYDASNVIPHKDAAVITNIGLDHLGIIGNNKEEICYEKSGIIRETKLAFTSEKNKSLRDIMQKESDKVGSELIYSSGKALDIKVSEKGTQFNYQDETYSLKAPGKHQVKNAILCIEVARKLGIDDPHIKKGLERVDQPLRMEVVSTSPLVILDGAHNNDKIASTVETMSQIITDRNKKGKLKILIGFSNNKTLVTMLKKLKKLNPDTVICTRNTQNAFRMVANPTDLAKLTKKHIKPKKVETYIDPLLAYQNAKKTLKKGDILLVTGSIYLSGELRGA